MTVIRLLDVWDEIVDSRDNAYDYDDYKLGNHLDNYLDTLAFEIDCFWSQM